jgi:hypothetical protein
MMLIKEARRIISKFLRITKEILQALLWPRKGQGGTFTIRLFPKEWVEKQSIWTRFETDYSSCAS